MARQAITGRQSDVTGDQVRTKFESIQYLRAFAALAVIFHHAIGPRPWLYNPISSFGAGQAGVDIFFLVSGFIIYVAARDEGPGQFAIRRAIRIVPLYWMATIVSFVSALRHGPASLDNALWPYFLKSLLFIPAYNYAVPNQIWPIFIPGWTLQYEVFFYGVFALGLAVRQPTTVVKITFVLLVFAGLLVRSDNPLWITYTDPLLLEFLAGLYLARYRHVLTSPRLAALIPIGLLALALSGLVPGPRFLQLGLPALAMVTGAIALENSGHLIRLPWLGKLGDASYSIYLSQFVAIEVASRTVQHLPVHGSSQLLAMIAASLLASTAIGMAVHQIFERPITRWLSHRRPHGAIEAQAAP